MLRLLAPRSSLLAPRFSLPAPRSSLLAPRSPLPPEGLVQDPEASAVTGLDELYTLSKVWMARRGLVWLSAQCNAQIDLARLPPLVCVFFRTYR